MLPRVLCSSGMAAGTIPVGNFFELLVISGLTSWNFVVD